MISQCHFTRGILPLLLSTRQRRNDMNGRDDTRDLHHCCDCVSLQYGSRILAADCIRKGKRIRSRQADDATFFNRGLCDHAALTIPACPHISTSCATVAAQLASRLRRWPLCRKLEGRSRRSNAGKSGLITHLTVSKSNYGAKIDRNSVQLPMPRGSLIT